MRGLHRIFNVLAASPEGSVSTPIGAGERPLQVTRPEVRESVMNGLGSLQAQKGRKADGRRVQQG